MPRKIDPLAPYRMSTHKLGAYVYASTQPAHVDELTGERIHRRIHWGRFDPEKKVFTPNMAFLLLDPKERAKFIFPPDWDRSAIETMAGLRRPGRQPQKRQGDRLYGDIWLLEKIAEKIGLRKDLLTVFDGNAEMVDMILTLAMYPYLAKGSFNRLPRWQRIVRSPCDEPLTPPPALPNSPNVSAPCIAMSSLLCAPAVSVRGHFAPLTAPAAARTADPWQTFAGVRTKTVVICPKPMKSSSTL